MTKDKKSVWALLAAAMKLESEVEINLIDLQSQHDRKVKELADLAQKVSDKEQELAIRRGEAQKLIWELASK